jgi:hypothetical protein
MQDRNRFDEVSDPVGAAPDFPQHTLGLQRGHGLFSDAPDLGVGGVVAALPALQLAVSDRHPDVVAGALVGAVCVARDAGGSEGVDDAVGAGGGQVVG